MFLMIGTKAIPRDVRGNPSSARNYALREELAKCMVRHRTATGWKLSEGTVRVNVSGLEMENALRALDDDPHVSVLINPSVTRVAFSPPGFPTRHWAVVFVFFSPQQTLVELHLTSVVVAVEKSKAFCAFQACALICWNFLRIDWMRS